MVPEARPVQGKNIAQPDSFFQRHMLSGRQENVYSGQTFATGERRMVALRTIEPGDVPLDKPLVAMVTRDLDAVHHGWFRHVVTIALPFVLTLLLTGSALAIFQRRQRLQLKRLERADADLRASEERWSFALEGGGDCVWDWNLQTGDVMLSKAGKPMFGYADDEIADRIEEWEKRLHPDDKPRINEDLKAYLQGRAPTLVSEYRVLSKGGQWKWILTRGMAVDRAADGRVTRMIGTHADISERREREEALKLAGVVLETVDEGVIVTDAHSRIISVNPGFTEITGYTQEEVLGRTPKLLSAGTHSADFYRSMWETLNNTGSWKGEVLNRKKNGEFYVEWLSIKQLRDERGAVSHYVGVFSDISERKASEERMIQLAHCDALTGLANRMLLTDRIHQALSKARRDHKRVAVLFFDLDRFKPVKDQFGHDVGDLLLQQVAQRVLACVRESDTVARLGGDEFVVLLTEIEEEANALAVGRKILAALQRPFDPLGHLVTIGASIGVAVFPDHGGDETVLLKNADIAMYKAKACGRNTVMPFTNDTAHELA
jgi:diguanylate cyclase (GGDEF)-like protein/PAS domain S-box-containing protein